MSVVMSPRTGFQMHRATYSAPVQCTNISFYMPNFARKWYNKRHPDSSIPAIIGVYMEAVMLVP